MNVRSTDLVAYALLAGSVLVGLLLWSSLPDSMAIHFGVGGEPDSFVAKPVGVLLAPTIGLGAVVLTRYGPERASRTYGSPYIENVAVVFTATVIAYAQGFVYAWNLGYRPGSLVVLAPVLLAAGAFVAYTYTRDGTPS
jgi:uncharacterized membrane protein